MIFNTYQKNQTRNLPSFDSVKNYSSMVNKTRVESLNERIHAANEFINFFVEKTKTENKDKIDKKEEISKPEVNIQEINKSENNNNLISNTINTNKSVQVDENNINNDNKENNLENNNNINDAITENKENNNIENNNIEDNKNTDEELNNLNKIENNNEENANIDNKEKIDNNEEKIKNENFNNIEEKKEEEPLKEKKEEKRTKIEDKVDIPFVKKIKSLLSQLKDLKEKSVIKEEDYDNEINNELPKRSLIEISLSDIKSKRNCEILKNKLIEKEKHIKELESELFKQRKENIQLKKSENEYLLKISALEDELRVFKNEFIKYYSQTEKNSPHEYGERLVRSMWVRDNIIEDKINNNSNNNYNNNNNYINNYNNKYNKNYNNYNNNDANSVNSNTNSNSNMTFSNANNLKHNRNSYYKNKWNSPWNSQTQRKINNNEFINNNFRHNNGGLNNFQKVSGMILDKNKNNIRNRLINYEIDINRFRD